MSEPTELSDIQRALHSRSVNKRRKAARELSRYREDGVLSLLISALSDSDYAVRRYATRGLAQFNDESALNALLDAVRDRNRFVRSEALSGLERRIDNPRVLEAFVAALDDRSYLGRTVAVVAARHSEALADAVAGLPPDRRTAIVNTLLNHLNSVAEYNAAEVIRLISALRLVEALPHLRNKLRWWRFTPAKLKQACQEAIAELEKIAALPRAASTPAPPIADLPRPAGAPNIDVEKLPRVTS
jgi:HEAT repeat protein